MPPTVKRFAASADPHLIHQYIKADGVAIIEGATTRESLDEVREQLGTIPAGETFGVVAKSATFATQLLVHPLFMDLANRVLTDTCIIYYEQDRTVSISEPQVSMTSVLSAEPGSAPWGLRRQDECHHITHPAQRESDFGVMYAMDDITVENGAVRVVVGSNNWTDHRDPMQADEGLVELRKGDALLWLGSTYYGRAANTTNEPTMLLRAVATPGYRRQEENQYLAAPWEVVEKYPTAVQRFLGYSISRPYGGSVEHMEPLDFLKVKGDWSKYIPVDLI
ncbi:hypothetical protein P170DRAFT_474304 [Aspergillus steynii IBT 23096]|uniref:Phytanoyl-CoA dioxygenase family protein n=1 Tax=Aspergillus steynii IBT 23096 TaxID=1392250 RepID=A0A2I2GCY9_9EURO|nr:uncharacterized protein P170DRAFT_474304 [Aspergillus steynii IBT 23096]PLB50748.1 hypothetical protein P170DRAFT_474304 [Aspergillus steynii IBT 23096]